MFKKISMILIILISICTIQYPLQAAEIEEPGLKTILFEKETKIINHKSTTSELWYTLIKLHTIATKKDIITINYQWEELEIIKRIEELTKIDIIQLLNLASDKQIALSEYLQNSYKELNKWDTMAAYMKQEMETIKIERQECIIDKQISDKMYVDAINVYDQKTMELSLNESILYEICASEKKIQYNSRLNILKKLVFYLWILQKKYDILFDKQEILAKNFKIFRDNILPDLNEINTLIQQYDL